jgi:RimJ/RimL family protein N-acetyltransferase
LESRLSWGEATQDDRQALQHFTCAEPDDWQHVPGAWGRRFHPAVWQLVIQKYIRDLRVPIHDEHVLLGRDLNGELIAVAHYARSDEPDTVFIKALGVRSDHWQQRYGLEALRWTLDHASLEPWRTPGRELYVSAWVHQDNVPSAKTCRAAGMSEVAGDHIPPEYREWAIMLPEIEATL